VNCLDETTIHVNMILYLSLYYFVNELVHLPNSIINKQVPQDSQTDTHNTTAKEVAENEVPHEPERH